MDNGGSSNGASSPVWYRDLRRVLLVVVVCVVAAGGLAGVGPSVAAGAASSAGVFVAVTPARALDTRDSGSKAAAGVPWRRT